MPKSNRAREKKVLIVSDIHAGHKVGLTPPELDPSMDNRWGHLRSILWNEYTNMVTKDAPYDLCLVNGDCIDGDGKRSRGTEQVTTDRLQQVKMAKKALEYIDAKDFHFTYGTPYHTGMGEDYEDLIADHFNAPIGGHEWAEVNGRIIDLKHKVGNTSIPYGKGTAIQKERMWNLIWAEHQEQPKADIFVRSHNHWAWDNGDHEIRLIQTPALQGMGSKFGSRQCSGIVHFGVITLFINPRGGLRWEYQVKVLREQCTTTTKY